MKKKIIAISFFAFFSYSSQIKTSFNQDITRRENKGQFHQRPKESLLNPKYLPPIFLDENEIEELDNFDPNQPSKNVSIFKTLQEQETDYFTKLINNSPQKFNENFDLIEILELIENEQKTHTEINSEELNIIGAAIAKHINKHGAASNVRQIIEILTLLPKSNCLDQINPETGQAPIHTLAPLHWIQELQETISQHTAGTTTTQLPDPHPGSTYASIIAGILKIKDNDFRKNPSQTYLRSHFINAQNALIYWFKKYPSCIGLPSELRTKLHSEKEAEVSCWSIIPSRFQLTIAQSFTDQDKKNIKRALDNLVTQKKLSNQTKQFIMREIE